MKQSLLFVCLGNICRSPAAEGVFKAIARSRGLDVVVDSAGTYGGHAGELPDRRMRKVAEKRGYCLDSRARRFRTEDFDRFDRIIVMDDSNYADVCRMAPQPEQVKKVCRMADFCRKYKVSEIPDPYYEQAEGFEYVLDLLEDACATLADYVAEQAGAESV